MTGVAVTVEVIRAVVVAILAKIVGAIAPGEDVLIAGTLAVVET